MNAIGPYVRREVAAPSTPRQRLYIRTMLQQLDLPTDYVTRLNCPTFRAANLEQPRLGRRVDEVLEALTKTQASMLIKALEKEVADL